MKLRLRRFIYLTFITFFIIIVPVITLYAAGYSYNFKKNKIEKTGILYIESKPKDAQIYINGKYQANTPKRFSRLLPDNYQVDVEKTGYYPWQKKLEVKSNSTTFSKNIVLFKKNLPINIIEGQINILSVSPNQEKMVYSLLEQNTEELRLRNLKNQLDLSIEKLNSRNYDQLEPIEWSPDQSKVLLKETIGDFNKYLIIDTETLKVNELFDITRLNFTKVNWDTLNGTYLYGLRNAILYQIDLVNNSTKTLVSANIEDFQIKREEIYYITRVINESFLNRSILENQTVSKSEKIKLPSPSQYTLQPSSQNYIVLLDKKNNDLFVISPKSFTDQDINQNVILQDRAKKIIWSKNLKRLLYYTDFEIWTFDFVTRQKNLITRYGETIKQAFWYTGENYIIYQINNQIKVIEDSLDEAKNDIQLTDFSEIDSVTLDNTGTNLYFKGKAGNQSGIYQLAIQ
ncbi:MAG: PEGA domain-containing protein [Patescibacteria group bacterium]|jgi:hypothetical protein